MLRKSLLRGYTNLSSPISRYGFSSSDQNRKFNVLFFGTDIIAKTVLEALHKNQLNQFKTPVVNKLETVTSADISGKKNQHPVKIFSYEKNIRKDVFFCLLTFSMPSASIQEQRNSS
jgi:hypothetical protein